MDKTPINEIASLLDGSLPKVEELTPDVRSGTTFTFKDEAALDNLHPVMLIWIYTVEPTRRVEFADAVEKYEDEPAGLPVATTGVFYHGTYSVSISSVSPDFEFRTFWGLKDLSCIGALNNYVRDRPTTGRLNTLLDFIAARPTLRSEIMGRTRNAVPSTGSHSVP